MNESDFRTGGRRTWRCAGALVMTAALATGCGGGGDGDGVGTGTPSDDAAAGRTAEGSEPTSGKSGLKSLCPTAETMTATADAVVPPKSDDVPTLKVFDNSRDGYAEIVDCAYRLYGDSVFEVTFTRPVPGGPTPAELLPTGTTVVTVPGIGDQAATEGRDGKLTVVVGGTVVGAKYGANMGQYRYGSPSSEQRLAMTVAFAKLVIPLVG